MPDYAIILIRALFSFIILFGLARLMGKKQLSQLTFFDYVVGITIGSIAATTSVDPAVTILNGTVALLVWGGLPILLSFTDLKTYRFLKVTEGTPTILVHNGKVLDENLRKEQITIEDMMILLREKSAFKLADVEFAVMETNGQVSVLKKSDVQPATPQTLGIKVKQEGMPHIVIMDGHLMEQTLRDMGYSKEWLFKEIKKHGAKEFKDVFLAQLETNGKLFVDLKVNMENKPK